jgi:acetyl-CoA synthetase
MKQKTVEKPQEFFKKEPALKDYEAACKDFDWSEYEKEVDWLGEGKLNAAHEATKHRSDETAMYWEGADGEKKRFTYNQVNEESNKFANALRELGVRKGERVFLFLPRVPEVHFSFLGTLKAGAIAGTLFSAFGLDALKDRIGHSEASVVITDSNLKKRIDEIRGDLPALKHVILVDSDEDVGDALSYKKLVGKQSTEFEAEPMDKDDYAFMLYTSGTTGKPKGIVHAHGGIIQQKLTAKWVLDLREDDVYWCTADHGWVTGISYGILGPLTNKTPFVVFDGRFNAEKWYSIIEEYKVSVWYTAPTAIRMLMKSGEELVEKHDLSSLRLLYSVGEPLNPEAIEWGLEVFGKPFHDTWWQTETGSQLIVNYPCQTIKEGSMGRPFPGITAAIIDENGNELPDNQEGNLAIKPPWPSIMRTVWADKERYEKYFLHGWFTTGDRALRDDDGYYWFIGRADDVIKTSGERVGPFEVESVLVEHEAIAEAGVIGKPDMMRGEIIKAFITLNDGVEHTPELDEDIKKFVKTKLAGHAYPREIEVVDSLPKTRSGKIMRRVLKAKELGLDIGDTSTLEND